MPTVGVPGGCTQISVAFAAARLEVGGALPDIPTADRDPSMEKGRGSLHGRDGSRHELVIAFRVGTRRGGREHREHEHRDKGSRTHRWRVPGPRSAGLYWVRRKTPEYGVGMPISSPFPDSGTRAAGGWRNGSWKPT
jgi:hypothetical protein